VAAKGSVAYHGGEEASKEVPVLLPLGLVLVGALGASPPVYSAEDRAKMCATGCDYKQKFCAADCAKAAKAKPQTDKEKRECAAACDQRVAQCRVDCPRLMAGKLTPDEIRRRNAKEDQEEEVNKAPPPKNKPQPQQSEVLKRDPNAPSGVGKGSQDGPSDEGGE
jgi:hypothetical protein